MDETVADGDDDEHPCDHTERSWMDALQAQTLGAHSCQKEQDQAHWEVSVVEVQELVMMVLMKSELKRKTEPYSYFRAFWRDLKASRTQPHK